MTRQRLILSTLLFSTMMISSPSYAEWTELSENMDGDIYYVDFERIRKHGGYVYYWQLSNYLKPTEVGILSVKSYQQSECKLFRYKNLSLSISLTPVLNSES